VNATREETGGTDSPDEPKAMRDGFPEQRLREEQGRMRKTFPTGIARSLGRERWTDHEDDRDGATARLRDP